jgi:hypothetical protein
LSTTHVLVFPVVSVLLAFPPISYMHFSSPPFVLYALPISTFLTSSLYTWRRVQVMKLLIMPNSGTEEKWDRKTQNSKCLPFKCILIAGEDWARSRLRCHGGPWTNFGWAANTWTYFEELHVLRCDAMYSGRSSLTFRRKVRPPLRGWIVGQASSKVQAVGSFETSTDLYWIVCRHIREDRAICKA